MSARAHRFMCGIALGALFAGPAGATNYGPYEAELVRVIDGDTYTMDVRIWPQLTIRTNVRLLTADTPELRGGTPCARLMARNAQDFAAMWLASAKSIRIDDARPDAFGGRMLARVMADGADLGEHLIAANLARAYRAGDTAPWCAE